MEPENLSACLFSMIDLSILVYARERGERREREREREERERRERKERERETERAYHFISMKQSRFSPRFQ